MLSGPVLLTLLLMPAPQAMEAAAPAALESRPRPEDTSPLQRRIDEARPGSVIDVDPGTYEGDLIIDRALRLVGHGRPRLLGSGHGSVVRIRATDVTVEGFDIDGRGGGTIDQDASGVHVAAARATIRDCRIDRALFGIYLRQANGAVVDHCVITGVRDRDPGEQGSGIHVFDTDGFTLTGNTIQYMRDGIYIQASPHGVTRHNTARDLRYGLHYMSSDDNTFEDNLFERGAAGAALMYSRRLVFKRNRFFANRGFASVGLLLQVCDDVLAEDNLIADNARGVFMEGSHRTTFRRNVIANSDTALVIYDSAREGRFLGNVFLGNLSPLLLVGRRSDLVVDGNYWSGSGGTDFDNDGIEDRPYRLSNVFDHLRGNLTAADLFAQGVGASVLAKAEDAFPVLNPVPVVDAHPLVRPPALPDVPAATYGARGGRVWGAVLSGCAAAAGLVLLVAGGRRRA